MLLFYVLVLASGRVGILAPRPGIERTPPVLEGEVLTIGLPVTSIIPFFKSQT